MKILHIAAGYISVGAVKGAYELHKSLLQKGVDSRILMIGREGEPGVLQCTWYEHGKAKEVAIINEHPNRKEGFICTGMQAEIDPELYSQIDWADVVHIHFIGLGFGGIDEIVNIKKQKLITLRDMWFFTGICNYSDSCKKYLSLCGKCQQLGSSLPEDWSTVAHENKMNFLSKPLKDLHFSAISSWIKNAAEKSSVLKQHKISMIPNGVDTEIFFPEEKTNNNILFIAANISNKRKGFDLFVESINNLKRNDISITVVGRNSTEAIKCLPRELKVRSIEYIDDDNQLRVIYGQAHLLAFASREEVFGKTITEAMACGTPTVAFDIGGPSEIIEHKVTGYLVPPYDTTSFTLGIEWALNQKTQKLSKQCRNRALDFFCQSIITKKYIDKYLSIIKSR